MIKSYQEFIYEAYGDPLQLSADAIIRYISNITPNESDVPDYFLSIIKKSGKNFELRRVRIQDLLDADDSLKEYVESGEERYGEDDESGHIPDPNSLNEPIVVFDGQVVDGYSRTATHYRAGTEFIDAYVSI